MSRRCPQCAEKIKTEALVCRHCGARFDEDEVRQLVRGGQIRSGITAIGALLLIGYCATRPSAPDTTPYSAVPTAISDASAPTSPYLRMRMTRFTWEAWGDRYCKASAKFTNTSEAATRLPFVRVTLQFLRKGQLVGQDSSYLDVTDLAPGASSTWDAMYECPGKGTTVEITAVSRGDAVTVTD